MKHIDAVYDSRTPEDDAFWTHYYIMELDGQYGAIGEAGDVKEIGQEEWHACVAVWGLDPETHKIDPDECNRVQRRTVQGPTFRLMPKDRFDGVLPAKLVATKE